MLTCQQADAALGVELVHDCVQHLLANALLYLCACAVPVDNAGQLGESYNRLTWLRAVGDRRVTAEGEQVMRADGLHIYARLDDESRVVRCGKGLGQV
jgi:hypothetical protein